MAGRIFTFILSVLFTLYMSVLYNSNGFLFVFYAEILIGSMLFIMNMILFFKQDKAKNKAFHKQMRADKF